MQTLRVNHPSRQPLARLNHPYLIFAGGTFRIMLALVITLAIIDQAQAQMPSPAAVRFTTAATMPTTAEEYFDRALAKHDKGDYQGAIADYNQAIKLKPHAANAYYNRGITHANLGDKKRAIADYTQTIKLKPDYPTVYNSRCSENSSVNPLCWSGRGRKPNRARSELWREPPKLRPCSVGRTRWLQARGYDMASKQEPIRLRFIL
jgi:tetratricopeptide (TPR) repeat protein